MQIVKQQNISTHCGHGNSIVDEYFMIDKTIDLCVVHINGRVPIKGKIINSNFTCVCYVSEGDGTVCGNKVVKGDVFNILSGESYWFDGKFTIIMSGTPAFDPTQSKVVDLND